MILQKLGSQLQVVGRITHRLLRAVKRRSCSLGRHIVAVWKQESRYEAWQQKTRMAAQRPDQFYDRQYFEKVVGGHEYFASGRVPEKFIYALRWAGLRPGSKVLDYGSPNVHIVQDAGCIGCFHNLFPEVPIRCPQGHHECMERITPEMVFGSLTPLTSKCSSPPKASPNHHAGKL